MIKLFRNKRNKMIKKSKVGSYLAYAIGEILLIVVGILLALYVQNKNEEGKTKKIINSTIVMIKEEINANKAKIEKVRPYHIMVRDTLQKMTIPKSQKEVKEALGFWRGMNTPRLQEAAFQTSIQSGVGREIDIDVLQKLNNLYTYQQAYNDFTSRSSQIFFTTDFTDYKSFGRIMGSIQITMNDLFYYEKELIKVYSESLSKIDSVFSPE